MKRIIVEFDEDLSIKAEGVDGHIEAIGLLEMGKFLILGLIEEKSELKTMSEQ